MLNFTKLGSKTRDHKHAPQKSNGFGHGGVNA